MVDTLASGIQKELESEKNNWAYRCIGLHHEWNSWKFQNNTNAEKHITSVSSTIFADNKTYYEFYTTLSIRIIIYT